MSETEEREQIARRRIVRILDRHTIALMRTLEQKISDAGPYGQRIDPHILTNVRKRLRQEEIIVERWFTRAAPWFFLPRAFQDEKRLNQRFKEQWEPFLAFQQRDVTLRVGQALEIAIYRTLCDQNAVDHFGSFPTLNDHDDSKLFTKQEPPNSLNGRHIQGKKSLDFLVRNGSGPWAGIEAKNIREWVYPDSRIIKELLQKCLQLDVVPVLMTRRIQYSLFSVLNPYGFLIHQTYRQRLPEADAKLAEKLKDKNLLSYHDIRLGNGSDDGLRKFLTVNLPKLLPKAYAQFQANREILESYAFGRINYQQFKVNQPIDP